MCMFRDDDLICLVDENDVEHFFETMHLVEFENGFYAVLLPYVEDNDSVVAEIVAVNEHATSEEDTFVGVEDERIVNEVFEVFKTLYADEYTFD